MSTLGVGMLVTMGVLAARRGWPAAASPSPYGVAWWAIATCALLYGSIGRGVGARLAASLAVTLTLVGGILLLITGGMSLLTLVFGGASVCGGGDCAARQTADLVGDFPLLALDVPAFLCALWVCVQPDDTTPGGGGYDRFIDWRADAHRPI